MRVGSVFAAALLVGCSGSSGGGNGAAGSGQVVADKATKVAFALQLLDAQCGYFERCAAVVPGSQRYLDECKLVEQLPDALAALWVIEDDEIASYGGYDKAAGDACLRAIAAASCTDGATLREACGRVFVGTLAPGACCGTDDECVPNAYCRYQGVGGDGVCTLRPGLGEDCSLDAPCGYEQSCDLGKCVATLPVGADCSAVSAQASEDACGRVPECAGGVCVRPTYGAAGAACDEDAAQYCLGELECNAGTCQLRTGAAVGQSCATSECAAELFCDDGSEGDGLCHEPSTLGDSCTPGRDTELFVCDAGTQRWRLGRLGDACEQDSQCVAAGGYCNAGQCIVQRADGAGCERDTQCAGLRCDEGTCGDIFAGKPRTTCAPALDGAAGSGMP